MEPADPTAGPRTAQLPDVASPSAWRAPCGHVPWSGRTDRITDFGPELPLLLVRLSPLTVTYVHSVLKSALEHAVREDELPRNVARNVRATAPRPRRFRPFTATEAR